MKYLILIFAVIAVGFIAVVPSPNASAVDIFSNCGNGSVGGKPDVCGDTSGQSGNNGTNNPVVKILKAAITILSYVIGVAAIVVIIVSGLRMILANGDSNAVSTARSGVIYAIVGVVIAILAQAIVHFVLDNIH